jgi:hypothetical protein
MISLAGLKVATDVRAALMISSGVNVILQLPRVCLKVFAIVLGLDALTSRAEGNRFMKCNMAFVNGLQSPSSSGKIVCRIRCISTFAADIC